jgi:hypothetical protein
MLNNTVSKALQNSSSDVTELRSQARLGAMPIVPASLRLVRICGIALGTIQMIAQHQLDAARSVRPHHSRCDPLA